MIGPQIAKARRALGWDTWRLAQEAAQSSLTAKSIHRIERGIENPGLDELEAICRALGLSREQLQRGHFAATPAPPAPTATPAPSAAPSAPPPAAPSTTLTTEPKEPIVVTSSTHSEQRPHGTNGAEPPTEPRRRGRKPGQVYAKKPDDSAADIDARWETFQTEAMAEGDNAAEHRRTYYAGAMDMLSLLFDKADANQARTLLAQCQRGILKRG